MKYERLTDEKFVKAVENCNMACVYGENCIECVYFKVDDCAETIQGKLKKAILRRAELEDKIEQGTLIELKYPLHKAVYFLRNGAVEEGVIVSFNYNRYTNPKMWYSIEYYITALKSYYVEVVKEDMIYPTREEAEKRLKEIQNG